MKKHRMLSLILALMLVCTVFMSVPAFAADDGDEQTTQEGSQVPPPPEASPNVTSWDKVAEQNATGDSTAGSSASPGVKVTPEPTDSSSSFATGTCPPRNSATCPPQNSATCPPVGKPQNATTTDNPQGVTIDNNYIAIGNNYGTIVNNTEAGSVENNLSLIEENLGTVENNKTDAMITDNDGEVGQNDGIIMNNNGEVTLNFSGTIMNNYDTIDVNKGEGHIYNNHGEILENRSDVAVNRQDGTVANAKDSTGAGIYLNYGIVENASLIEMEGMEFLPFGEGAAAGTDTLVGISYARDGVDVHLGGMWDEIAEQTGEAGFNPVEQYVATSGEDYVIKDYAEFEQYLGEIESGKQFVGWKGSDGKKYKVGDLYNKLSPLQLTAIIKAIQKAEKKQSASKAPSLTVLVNGDGSYSIRGGSINYFIAATMDDELIDPANYTLAVDENGRMMLLFTEAYLQSLAAGEHVIMFCFSNGTSHAKLTV